MFTIRCVTRINRDAFFKGKSVCIIISDLCKASFLFLFWFIVACFSDEDVVYGTLNVTIHKMNGLRSACGE